MVEIFYVFKLSVMLVFQKGGIRPSQNPAKNASVQHFPFLLPLVPSSVEGNIQHWVHILEKKKDQKSIV